MKRTTDRTLVRICRNATLRRLLIVPWQIVLLQIAKCRFPERQRWKKVPRW